MASTPAFATVPHIEFASISTANTNRDGTGTIGTIATGVAAGTKVNEVVVQATGNTTAGMVRLYLTVDGGTTWRLHDEIEIGAVTVSASVRAVRMARRYENLMLYGTSAKLGASTHIAETFVVYMLGADL